MRRLIEEPGRIYGQKGFGSKCGKDEDSEI